jgi:hypothetical protein
VVQADGLPVAIEDRRAARALQRVGLVEQEAVVAQVEQLVVDGGVLLGRALRMLDDVDRVALERLTLDADQGEVLEIGELRPVAPHRLHDSCSQARSFMKNRSAQVEDELAEADRGPSEELGAGALRSLRSRNTWQR